MNEALNKIKQFENGIKKVILSVYGKYLPEDKISLMNITNYTTEDLLNGYDDAKIRGTITRRIMGDLINVNCYKEFTLDNGEMVNIVYGEDLEQALIEKYTRELSEKFHFDINKVEGLDQDLETIKLLNEKLGSLDEHVFSEDAIKLLDAAQLKELVQKCDEEAINNYLNQVKTVAGTETKEQVNELMKESVERIDSVQIVWLGNKKHIKYIDEQGKVHLTEINNSPKIDEFYNKKLASVQPGEKINPEQFYHELKDYAKEMELMSTNDVKKDELNSEQLNMLNFIESSPAIKKAQENDISLHNSQMDIHVMQSTKDIVTTSDKTDHVESDIVRDGSAVVTSKAQDDINISSKLISKEEYEKLSRKFKEGENLTREELEQLRRVVFIYGQPQEEEQEETKSDDSPAVLKPSNASGFTAKSLILYIVLLAIFIGTTIAIFLLK